MSTVPYVQSAVGMAVRARSAMRPAAAVDGAWIVRLVARFIGAGYVAYFAVALPEMWREATVVSGWWTPTAIVVVFGPGVALLAATFGTGTRYVRVFAVAAVAGYVVAAAGWLVAWTGEGLTGTRGTWLVTFSGLVGLCAALVWRPVWVCAVQAAATAGSSVINQLPLQTPQDLWVRVSTETVWALGFSGVFVAGVMMAVRTAGELDATREEVGRDAASAAARVARDGERARFDALVHDRVIATLLEAARTNTPRRLPAQARAALTALDGLAAPTGDSAPESAAAVMKRLQRALADCDHDVALTTYVHDPALTFPVDAVSAVAAAMAEAVRNSASHAGPAAHTRVNIELAAGRLKVDVVDSGQGFDPETAGMGRFGIAGSITARLKSVPGGRSAIVSQRGAGTVVELEWAQPAAPGTPRTASSTGSLGGVSSRSRGRALRALHGRQTLLDGAEGAHRGDASTIIGMQTRWATAVAAGFVACAVVATAGSFASGMSLAPAMGSLALLAAGVVVVVAARGDPIHRWSGMVCAAVPALQIAVVWPGLPVPLSDPLQASATVGGGVVVCAFLCVRGRVGWAWAGQVAACAVYAWWGIATGQGPEVAVPVYLSNAGVMMMATFFAAILRPAARDIYRLRAEHAARSAERAAIEAARVERAYQLRRLDELARPMLTAIADQAGLSDQQRTNATLLEARLRDSIRARAFDTPDVARAAWAARARGVSVLLFDDGALDDAETLVAARLQHAAALHLDAAQSGSVTIRVAPPGRPHLATVIEATASATVRHEYDHAACESAQTVETK